MHSQYKHILGFGANQRQRIGAGTALLLAAPTGVKLVDSLEAFEPEWLVRISQHRNWGLRHVADGDYVAVDGAAPDWFCEVLDGHKAEIRGLLDAGFLQVSQ